MILKTAAFLALIGTLLLTVLLAIDFINSVLALAGGLVPAVAVLRLLIYLVASLTVTVSFYVFNKAQSRLALESLRAAALIGIAVRSTAPQVSPASMRCKMVAK
jgi:hypothetical protein